LSAPLPAFVFVRMVMRRTVLWIVLISSVNGCATHIAL
jgi:hypothetical protein